MPHYRKLTLDYIDYQYNIGKKFVEIRPFGSEKIIVSKVAIGFKPKRGAVVVTPKMIADYIKGDRKDVSSYFPTCPCMGVSKSLGIKPYDYEIDNKSNYVYWCDQCYANNADDI